MLASNMSCVDVMYQPYASYFSYQRPSAATAADTFKKYGSVKMHDSLDTMGAYSAAAVTAAAVAVSQHTAAMHPGHSPVPKLEDPDHSHHGHGPSPHDKDSGGTPPGPHNAQYLSTNCVLFTYYAGDVASNVDEHFSRALSQPSSFSSGDNSSHSSKSPTSWKDSSPMSQRNFPASFWNSSYQPSVSSLGHHDPLASISADPYVTASLHSMPSLGSDPWRYPLTSQPHTYSHSHHGVHDMAYAASMAGTSRFQPHYSSLLGSSRLGSVAGQCELGKHAADTWSSRYHADPLGSNLTSHHDTPHLHTGISAGGIDGPIQEPSKDLYWF